MSTMQTMALDQLRAAFDAGGLSSASLRAQGKAFYIIADSRIGPVILVRRSDRKPRTFAEPRRAMALLRDMGFVEIKVDMTLWDVKQGDLYADGGKEAGT